MSGSPAQEIKGKLDLVQFLRGYLNLQPAGKNFKALCPFHREKTPSFMISPERQTWHCFGCGIGGDVFAFLMRYESLEFGEALRVLAEKAGIELRRINPGEYEQLGILYDANEAAKEFFKSELKKSAPALKYLEKRKLEESTIIEFELGWAPASSESLSIYLLKAGFRPEIAVKAGLAIKNIQGLQVDRFRGRIMFPIENHLGKTVGFTGRVLPEFDTGETGKYVNSPETPIFNKSRILYGLSKSRACVKEQNFVIMVEGQMDLLMCWQAGIKNIAATSGTALTADHLRLLKRYTEQLVVSFDNDEAGKNAGERALDLAAANDFNVKVALLDAERFKDPAEAAEKDPVALKAAFHGARPAMEFYFSCHIPNPDSPHFGSIKKGVRSVLKKIKNISSPVEQNYWIQKLHERVHVGEQALRDEMEALESGGEKEPRKAEIDAFAAEPVTRWELVARHFLAMTISGDKWNEAEASLLYLPGEYRQVFQLLQQGEKGSFDPGTDHLINLIYLEAGGDYGEKEFALLQGYLKEECLKVRRNTLMIKIKQAEQKGDNDMLNQALREFQAILGEA